jgi:hypothetical protein
MKKILTIIFVTIFFLSGKGQLIGIKLSPSITVTELYSNPALGFSIGFFYDQKIYKRIGISTGASYTQFRVTNIALICNFCGCIRTADDIFHTIEIPFDVSLRLSDKDTSKFQLFLTGGYSVGKIVETGKIIYECDNTSHSEPLLLPGLDKTINIGKAGLEVRHALSKKTHLAYGAQYKYTSIYYKEYGGFNNWNLYIKCGLNLK